MNKNKKGSLVCVGTGIMMGAQITPISKNLIINADVVFMSVSTSVMEEWICGMNSDVRNLQSFYEEGLSRNKTYRAMLNVILHEVVKGKNVCLVLYGHPGVFALVGHKAIKILKEDGHYAHMEPGISAEDCLFADLGIDPGEFGCQQYEATQFMMYDRIIDIGAYLILWQIGVAGDLTYTQRRSSRRQLAMLVERLADFYPISHEVIVYEAKALPIENVRIERVVLEKLPEIHLHDYSTLIIPPATSPIINESLYKKMIEINNI